MHQYELFYQLLPKYPNLKVLVLGVVPIIESLLQKLPLEDVKLDFCTSDKKLLARQYEIALVCDILDESILNNVYHALENSGNLILVLNKTNFCPINAQEILDAIEYRAVNTIDLFEDYYLLSAKKLHMWGNGH